MAETTKHCPTCCCEPECPACGADVLATRPWGDERVVYYHAAASIRCLSRSAEERVPGSKRVARLASKW